MSEKTPKEVQALVNLVAGLSAGLILGFLTNNLIIGVIGFSVGMFISGCSFSLKEGTPILPKSDAKLYDEEGVISYSLKSNSLHDILIGNPWGMDKTVRRKCPYCFKNLIIINSLNPNYKPIDGANISCYNCGRTFVYRKKV